MNTQIVQDHVCAVGKTGDGTRAVKVFRRGLGYPKDSFVVPLEICSLASGKDAWMREILFPCDGCGKPTKAVDLYSELPGHCSACSDAYFSCTKCGGTHHPDDGCPQVAIAKATEGK